MRLDWPKGHLPIVVMLEEPSWMSEHYTYHDMLYGDQNAEQSSAEAVGSPTLREVEPLLKQYALTLDDVSVFDVNTLLASGRPRTKDEMRHAHVCFWSMIRAKEPKVILILTTVAGKSEHGRVRQLWSSFKKTGQQHSIVVTNNRRKHYSKTVRAFHPSNYLRADYNTHWDDADRMTAEQMLQICMCKAVNRATGAQQYTGLDESAVRGRWRCLVDAK